MSITRAVNPPRAAFVDYPLGHTAGKPADRDDQFSILQAALQAFTRIDQPGSLIDLGFRWAEDDNWKDAVMRPDRHRNHEDDRAERQSTPQYQHVEDEARVADGCPGCVFLQAEKPAGPAFRSDA